jgi:hypothetical protein
MSHWIAKSLERSLIPGTARSKEWVCGLQPLVCCNRGFESLRVVVICLLCVVRKRSLRRADHSSRGVLPNVARRCV